MDKEAGSGGTNKRTSFVKESANSLFKMCISPIKGHTMFDKVSYGSQKLVLQYIC